MVRSKFDNNELRIARPFWKQGTAMKKTHAPRPMTRRRLLKIVAGVAGGAAGAYILYEMAPWLDVRAPAAKIRRPLQLGVTGNSLMRELVRYATLAASGHNAQPWQFVVMDSAIQIRPDRSRRLAAVDPDDRELWISLGCAVENLVWAARKAGYEPEVTYPESDEWIQVHLSPGKSQDGAYFDSIPRRQNTRSEFDGHPLERAEVAKLMSVRSEPGVSLRPFEGNKDIEKVLEYVVQGNERQIDDKAFIEELIHWIRFDKREALASMDGLYSVCMGSPQAPRWLGEQVFRRTTSQAQSDADAKKVRSSAGVIAIASESDTKAAWVRTGRVYQRLALQMTSMNIKSAFLNQPNEVATVRQQFQTAMGFGDARPQLLLRYGRANPMPSSLRRPVDEVIVWA